MTPISQLVDSAISKVSQEPALLIRDCYECGQSIGQSIVVPSEDYLRTCSDIICDPCLAKRDQIKSQAKLKRDKARSDKLLEQVPTAYWVTDRAKLPNPAKLDEALKWQYGKRGLLLFGKTRSGKSRTAWEVCKREIINRKSFAYLNPLSVAAYPSLLMGDSGKAAELAANLAKVDLLLLDDVFKATLTERVQELLFLVINERCEWERPCIVTLNDNSETLEPRFTTDRGGALMERLKEFCFTIQF